MNAVARLTMTFVATILLCGIVLMQTNHSDRMLDVFSLSSATVTTGVRVLTWTLFLVGLALAGVSLSGKPRSSH